MFDPEQKMRFTDHELGLIKSMFSEDAPVLYAIRKSMYQFELDEKEEGLIEDALNDVTKPLLRKIFLPELHPDTPLFQMTDMVIALGGDTKTLSPEGAFPFILAKKIEKDYVDQELRILFGEKVKRTIVLADLAKIDYEEGDERDAWVNITAFNFLLSYVDTNIAQLKVLAGKREETVEQTKARLRKDSTQ